MLNGLINTGQLALPGRSTARRTTLVLTGLNNTAIDLSVNVCDIVFRDTSNTNYNRPQVRNIASETGIALGNLLYLVQSGIGVAAFSSSITTGMLLKSTLPLSWSNAEINGGSDLLLYRDTTASLGQRNGVNAQLLSIYNTYTSATVFERGVFDWITTANSLRIGTEKGSGGGTARDLVLVTDGIARLTLSAAGLVTFAGPVTLKGYTVATLPTGVQGHTAFVTDATTPTYNAALTGGGAVVVPVFHNGTAWVSA